MFCTEAHIKSPQMLVYILSHWKQRFEDKIKSNLENRKTQGGHELKFVQIGNMKRKKGNSRFHNLAEIWASVYRVWGST